MSNRSILRRQRAKLKHNAKHLPAGLQPVCVVPGAVIPTGPAPTCPHGDAMVFVACECHPREGGWQCAGATLGRHMRRVR